MSLVLSIILVVGPLILGIYLSTRGIPRRTKRVVWIICALISLSGVILLARQETGRRRESKTREYYRQSQERRELYSKGLPTRYVDGLGENPLLKHSFKEGEKYEKEYKFDQAIEAYKKCLLHPNATEANKVAANVLIGGCHHRLSELGEAEEHYKGALSISKKVKDKDERLLGRSAALGGIGLIYSDLGKPDEALKYLEEALEIDRRIGYEQGIASSLNNIGLIYSDLGKPDEALKYHKEALEIDRRIGYEQGIARDLGNIGLIYSDLGKPDEALKYLEEALEIDRRIGYEQGIARDLGNIGVIYTGLGKPDEALKYHKEALEIDRRIGHEQGIARDLGNIGNIYGDLGKPDEALKHLKEALEIFRRIGAQPQIDVILKNIVIVEEKEKKRTQ